MVKIEVDKLRKTKVYTIVTSKEKYGIIRRFFGGFYGEVCYLVDNPATQKQFEDFRKVTKKEYQNAKRGDDLKLLVYKGKENPDKIYLMPEAALFN